MLIFVITAVAGVLALSRSERFAAWALAEVETRLDGLVRFEGVGGSFADGLRFARIEAVADAGSLVLENVGLRIDLGGILARALIIDELTIGGVVLDLSAARADVQAETRQAPPSLLVLIRSLTVETTTLVTSGTTYALGRTELGARYVDGSLSLSDVSSSFDQLDFQGGADVELGAPAISIAANACIRGVIESERVEACVEVDGPYPNFTVSAEATVPFGVSAAGAVSLAAPRQVDLMLDWRDAAIARWPDIRSPSGSIRLLGTLPELRVSGTGSAVYRGQTLDLEGSLTLDAQAISIESLAVQLDGQSAVLNGQVAGDFSRAELEVFGQHLDPALLHPEWPGDLELHAELTAARAAETLSLRVDDIRLGGELRDYPVVATGGVDWVDGAVTFRNVVVASRVDQVALSGTYGSELDLSVEAGILDLAAWWPELNGELDADLTIGGRPAQPNVRGELALRDAVFRGNRVDQLTISGQAGLGESSAIDVAAAVTGVRTESLTVDRLDAEVVGSIDRHVATIQARADRWSLSGSGAGGFAAGEWQGEIGMLDVEPESLESWTLERSSRVVVGATGLQLDPTCLTHADASVCVTVTRRGQVSDFIDVNATGLDLDLLSPFLPPGLGLAGRLDAVVEVRGLNEAPTGRIDVDGRAVSLRAEVTPGTEIEMPIDRLELEAAIEEGRLSMSGSFSSPDYAEGMVDLAVARLEQTDSPIEAQIELIWLDPAVLSVLSPDVGEVSGTIYVDIGVAGRLDAPTMRGEARWENGSIEVPVWGLVVDRINGRATATSSDRLSYTARGFIDDAELSIDGETELSPDTGFPTTLRLRGEALPLVQLPDVEIFVSPDLTATVALPEVSVSGRVEVPRALISAVGLSEQAVTPSRDTVVHGREQVEAAHPLDVTARLTLSLGDDVRYRDSKLTAQVSGDLDVEYQSERGATAVGSLTLTGDYDAYGTPLTLENGRLIFAGPWSNPAVDVRAVRRIEEVTVGVQLTGTLDAPTTRVFSEPTMSETNALSYLLLGRPLEDANAGDSQLLETAALSMGLRQAVPVIEKIGETLGLDDFAIQSTATDAGALMAGKYLSPNLYLRYSYGLFNRIGGLLLRYRINERLSIETQSGVQKSMDLLYTVEKE